MPPNSYQQAAIDPDDETRDPKGCVMTEFRTIFLEKTSGVAKLTLNRPDSLNAINEHMLEDLIVALEDISEDSSIRVLILTGAGRAFCAAADIEDERRGGDRLMGHLSQREIVEYTRRGPQRIVHLLHWMEKPTIAMVNGLAVGDGFDFALACDLRVGSTLARFMNGYGGMGLVSGTGAPWFYPRLLGLSKALELLYTGAWLEADEAHRLGLLNRLVPPDALEVETMDLAQRIAEQAPIPTQLVKGMVYRALHQSLDEHLVEAAYIEAMLLTTEDHREALDAYLQHREPKFTCK